MASGFASTELLAAIETAGWAPVLVSFEVPGVAPRLPERAYREARAQEAIATDLTP